MHLTISLPLQAAVKSFFETGKLLFHYTYECARIYRNRLHGGMLGVSPGKIAFL